MIEIEQGWKRKAEKDGEYAIAVALIEIAEAILHTAQVIQGLHAALRSDHPLQGETFGELSSAIGEVADAIREHGQDDDK